MKHILFGFLWFLCSVFFTTDLSPGNQFYVTSDGRVYGTAIHDNAGSVTGTTNQYFASGTWTPTLTNTTNVAASTPTTCYWQRMGNVVSYSGSVQIDVTSASTVSLMGMSLPIASNFTTATQAGGIFDSTGAASATRGGCIISDATNDRLSFSFTCGTTTANVVFSFSGHYILL